MMPPCGRDDLDLTSDHADDGARDPIDQVAEEFAERCRLGESPSISEYAERYPEHAQRLRELLPPVAMMERLKGRLRTSGSSAGLHEPRLERLGEFRIIRELGRGGMGIVYEAFQESLGRHVALKVIPRHGLLDARRRQRFQREAQAVARLHHTNIVPIFASGEHDGLPYFAMQYIRGSGLDRLLEGWRRDGLVRDDEHWRFVARVGIQAAEALQYAHDQGILHRDIKPANVLIDEHNAAWITDFGLAKLAGLDDLTNSGDIVGTLRYLAPEALRWQTDRRADIYSLGLTLYELLTLQLPFGDLTPSELLRCVTEEQPIRPRKLDRSIPLDLETIVLKATAREPSHRYATAGELAEDLRAFMDDRPIRARRASAPERLRRWYRRNRLLAGVSAFAAASFLAALVFATAGYISTNRALQKANVNVRLSLDAFNDLFNEFTDPADAGPFAEGVAPPDFRRSGPPPEAPDGPRRRPPSMERAPTKGRPTPASGDGPPPRSPDGEIRPPSGPGMPGGSRLTDRELAVLESILVFYDKFAERNETNSQLQVEAARAHRKVAALYRVLGHEEKAEEAQSRALRGFESLVARRRDDPEYIYELARTLALDGPGAHAVRTERAEPDLRRAIALVESLVDAAPEKKRITYAAALARWKARLASRLDELGRTDEAVASYRESIAHDEWLSGQISDPAMVREVLARHRDALARILIRVGRRDDARPLLDRAATDLLAVAQDGRPLRGAGEPVGYVLDHLANSYDDLGDGPRAIELRELAKGIRARCQEEGTGRRGAGRSEPRRGEPRRTGRSEAPGPRPSTDPGQGP